MGQITLVRHGQANSGAQTEEDYDRLSDLGVQQSIWLGEYLRETGQTFDRVLMGTLKRHKGTAEGMGVTAQADARLNEMDYLTLGKALEDTRGVPQPGPEGFAEHFTAVLKAWKRAEIRGAETFDSFETRVASVLKEASEPGRHVLCVTSGGVIAMMIRHLLGLKITKMTWVALPIWNTSIHQIEVTEWGSVLSAFNAVPHLDDPSREASKTRY